MLDWALLIAAAFAAGVVNAIAGGGTFLTFPALVHVGVPVIAANATSAVAVLPGYLSSTLGFRPDLAEMDRGSLVRFVIISMVGGLSGAGLLLVTPAETFSVIVPWLLLLATVLFALGGRIQGWLAHHSLPIPLAASLFVVSVYGGYFNGGLGIILLALFTACGLGSLNRMNGLKNLLSFALSLISVLAFAIAGAVLWTEAVVMMIAATAGGYAGARIARRLPHGLAVALITTLGAIMTVLFFVRG
ncbi:MAG: sulfite exporter TauE/SafE family protein [Gammaproteobacteria bacterium]